MRKSNVLKTKFWEKADYDRTKSLLMYGFGFLAARFIKDILEAGIKVEAIFDSNEKYHNTSVVGIPVLSPERIVDYNRDMNVFITNARFKYTLTEMFRKLGFNTIYYSLEPEMTCIEALINQKNQSAEIIHQNTDKISEARKLFFEERSIGIFDAVLDAWGNGNWKRLEATSTKEIVYPRDIFKQASHLVFAECGAYEGEGVYGFINEVKNQYDYIYAFEPSELEYTIASRQFEFDGIKNIETHCLAISDKDGTVYFDDNNSQMGATISQNGKVEVKSTTLDTFFAQSGRKMPTIIRMDIEGAEISALHGMKVIIKNHMPNLAISAYHRLEHYWEVPLTIAELSDNHGYEFFMRHHMCCYDTVCLARPKIR
jgi:FkbM family methyltransferase